MAVADSYSYDAEHAAYRRCPPASSGNDTDADGNVLTAAVVATVTHGSLTLGSTGGFTYTPTNGYTGPDSFTYRANDGTANSTP